MSIRPTPLGARIVGMPLNVPVRSIFAHVSLARWMVQIVVKFVGHAPIHDSRWW